MTSAPAIVSSSFYPHVGGVEELVRQLTQQQRSQGRRPIIATMRWPKDLPRSEDFDGVPVRRYVFRVAEPNVKQMTGALLTRRQIARQLAHDLAVHRATIVHVQCVSANAWYARDAARRLGLPLVVTLQGELTMDATGIYRRSKVLPALLTDLLHEADAVTACSLQTLREAEQVAGIVLGDRGRVIFNGVRTLDFDVPPRSHPRPYVLGIGWLVRQKGFDVLVRAFAELAPRVPHDLLLAGSGAEAEPLARLAGELGVYDRVQMLGSVSRREVPALFVGASCFVLPSRHEPMGIVNVEAMAAGAPLVATSVGGVPEIVQDGESGVLVAPEEPGALAAAVERVLLDPGWATRLREAGRRRARDFDWSRISAQYDEAYKDASDRASGAR